MKTGQQLGKYDIIGELGKGGFAAVYRARDPDLDREVALKVLDPLLTRDPVWVARFRREARAVARLDHPHVVTIYEVGQAEGMLYIATRLVEGGNLADRVREGGPLPWDEVVRLASQIASALDYAHDQGVVHRDLKSANVLLDEERGAQLTDFGFASIVSESSYSVSVSGGVVGTPQYIAPEVWEGKPATHQTDIYALGCILYEMVTGEYLFQGDTTPAVMRAHFQPVELPETWPEGVPPELGELLQKALVKEPGNRYAQAGDLTEALVMLREDRLAETYALLEVAVATEEWEQALELAQQIQEEDPEYGDVVALEETALAGLERAARTREAAAWRAEAKRALAEGDLQGAEMAARQWEALLPDDLEVTAFLAHVEAQAFPVEALPMERETSSLPQSPLSQPKLEPSSSARVIEPLPTREAPRRGVSGWVWAMGGVVAILAILVLLLGTGKLTLRPTPEPDTIIVQVTTTPTTMATLAPNLDDAAAFPTDEPTPVETRYRSETFADSNMITDLFLEDTILWAATWGGLVRWDTRDRSYDVITVDDGLPTNDLLAVYVDSSGTLWVGSASIGLARLVDGQWLRVPTADTGGSSQVQDIVEDTDGNLWIGTVGGGASRFDGLEWTNFTPYNSTVDWNVYVIYVDDDASLWFGAGDWGCYPCSGDLAHYDGESWESFGRDDGIPGWDGRDEADVWDIVRVPGAGLWVATPGGIGIYSDGKWEALSGSHLASLLVANGSVWGAGWIEGIVRYNASTGHREAQERFDGLAQAVQKMVSATDGTLWAGGSGLLQRSPSGEWTEHTVDSPIRGHVTGISQTSDGLLWVSSYGDLQSYDGAEWHSYSSVLDVDKFNTVFAASDGSVWVGGEGVSWFSDGTWKSDWHEYHVEEIIEDQAGAIWISTMYDGTILRYAGGEWAEYSYSGGDLPYDYVYSISSSPSGSIWIALGEAAIRIPLGGEKPDWEIFTRDTGLISDRVRSALEDSQGRYWFAASESVVVRLPDGSWQDFSSELGMQASRFLMEDEQGIIWVGGNGLSAYQGGDWRQVFPRGDSISDRFVAHDGTLWVALWRGGVCQILNGAPVCYESEPYGLASNLATCVFEDMDRAIWIGTYGGLSHFILKE